MVDPGIVQLPKFAKGKWATGEESQTLWQGQHLTIVAPPPSILVAAKLTRGEPRDLDDSVFLIEKTRVDWKAVAKAVNRLPQTAREAAQENLMLLRVVLGGPASKPKRPRRKPRKQKR